MAEAEGWEVPLWQPRDDDSHNPDRGAYATWMPYQVGQARAQAAAETAAPSAP